ncbi:hypothetical protein GN956_G581 [Arapaima gigas]
MSFRSSAAKVPYIAGASAYTITGETLNQLGAHTCRACALPFLTKTYGAFAELELPVTSAPSSSLYTHLHATRVLSRERSESSIL